MAEDPDDRSLRERADALQARMEKLEEEASAGTRASRQRGAIGKAWDNFLSVLGPIGSLLGWIVGRIGAWLGWVFLDKSDDGVKFSFRRALINLTISVIAVFGLHVTFKAIYFYSTYFEETVYVTGKQEIETGELYQFGGCTSLPCSTDSDNGKFYLVESSLYFPVMFYPEEDVFANIPQQNGACKVEGYGIYFRTLRWLYKSAQLYQHVVDVSCRPYTEEEIRRAVEGGQIVDAASPGKPAEAEASETGEPEPSPPADGQPPQ